MMIIKLTEMMLQIIFYLLCFYWCCYVLWEGLFSIIDNKIEKIKEIALLKPQTDQ